MDSITLENFINYCDEMMIANESGNETYADIRTKLFDATAFKNTAKPELDMMDVFK